MKNYLYILILIFSLLKCEDSNNQISGSDDINLYPWPSGNYIAENAGTEECNGRYGSCEGGSNFLVNEHILYLGPVDGIQLVYDLSYGWCIKDSDTGDIYYYNSTNSDFPPQGSNGWIDLIGDPPAPTISQEWILVPTYVDL